MSTDERPIALPSQPILHHHKLFAECQPKSPLDSTFIDYESDELIELGDTDDDHASDTDSIASLSPVYRMGPLQSTTTPIDTDQDDMICVEFSGDEATDTEHEALEAADDDSIFDDLADTDADSDYSDDSANDDDEENVPEDIIIQRFSRNRHITFDRVIETAANFSCVVDSHGRNYGVYEWEIEVVNTDVDLTEIGVIGTCDREALMAIDEGGIREAAPCGHRSVMGSELSSGAVFHATYGADGRQLCVRDLAKCRRIGWCTGDVVKVCLDLDDWRISYFVNGKPMGRAVQLQRGCTYYPVICFAGRCQYYLH